MKIDIEDVSFRYDSVDALNEVNVNIERGDLAVILGPNGSGKSTLLKCMDGILKIRNGAIRLDEKSLVNFSTEQISRVIAYIPQYEEGLTGMNVFDAVLLGRKPYIRWRPSDSDLQLVASVLRAFDLDKLAMRHVDALSGGQRQRVMIARAIAQEPSVLLLDEPTANLDLHHQMKVMELLDGLSKKGITIVVTMHDINLAARFCTQALMLRNGIVFASGNREKVFTAGNIEALFDIKVNIIGQGDDLFIIPQRFSNN
ncbi:MAG: ABC transporter ATP-binding protein [Bacteroidales bacterium]